MAQTITGFSLEVDFIIWGYSVWGTNEVATHVAENPNFELTIGSVWDWRPRVGVVTTIAGKEVPEWWRLPYVVKQYGDFALGHD